jgi:hypothetical protein
VTAVLIIPQLTKEGVREWITWFYSLLKPRAHNRIALIIVICGAAQLANPIWLPFAEAFAERYLDTALPVPANPLYGLATIAMALIYHYFSMRLPDEEASRKRLALELSRTRDVDHDTVLAKRVRELFTKQDRTSFAHDMLTNHMYCYGHSKALRSLFFELQDADFIFLNDEISKGSAEVVERASDLLAFMGLKFWVWPENQTKIDDETTYALFPWGNVDRAGDGDADKEARYDRLVDEMEIKLNVFMESFDKLLNLFHRVLHLHGHLPPQLS